MEGGGREGRSKGEREGEKGTCRATRIVCDGDLALLCANGEIVVASAHVCEGPSIIHSEQI